MQAARWGTRPKWGGRSDVSCWLSQVGAGRRPPGSLAPSSGPSVEVSSWRRATARPAPRRSESAPTGTETQLLPGLRGLAFKRKHLSRVAGAHTQIPGILFFYVVCIIIHIRKELSMEKCLVRFNTLYGCATTLSRFQWHHTWCLVPAHWIYTLTLKANLILMCVACSVVVNPLCTFSRI